MQSYPCHSRLSPATAANEGKPLSTALRAHLGQRDTRWSSVSQAAQVVPVLSSELTLPSHPTGLGQKPSATLQLSPRCYPLRSRPCHSPQHPCPGSGHRKVPKAADTCLLARLPLPTVSATLSRAGISREGKDHAQGWLCPAHTHHPVRPGSARPPQVWHAFCPRVPEASDGTDTEDPQQGQGQPVAKESHHNEQRLTPHRSPTSSKGLLGPSSGKRLRKHTAQRCKATILQ